MRHAAIVSVVPEPSQPAEFADFRELVARYQNVVCAVAYAATGDRAVSEEVAQDTFLLAWRKLPTLSEPPSLPGWLCGIARNLGRNARRKLQREVPAAAEHDKRADDGQRSPEELAAAHESDAIVRRALEQVPDDYREPLVLFYRSDRSIKEVAELLGLSEPATRQRLKRGRDKLKASVTEIVERSLAASRPGPTFTAAVVGALAASGGGGDASAAAPRASSTHATAGALTLPLLAGTVAAVGLALVAGGVYATRGDADRTRSAASPPQAHPPTSTPRDHTASTPAPGVPRHPRPALPAVTSTDGPHREHTSTPTPLDERAGLQTRIDLDLGEATVPNVLRLLADVMEVNIFLEGEFTPVNVRVTDTPAIDVLDYILEQAGATREEIPILRVVPGAAPAADVIAGDNVTITANALPLREAIAALAPALDIPIVVDASVPPTTVHGHFEDAPAGHVLAALLTQASCGYETDFGFLVRPDDRDD